jgi:hypothetical protein
MLKFFSTALLGALLATSAFALNEVANGDEIRARLGTSGMSVDLSRMKVAVLDNGFRGFRPNAGMLAAGAELIEGPRKLPETSAHGIGMAQILWEATGKKENGPKFYLINTNGFTNFKAAVDFVIANHVDIVLYSQVWAFGSDFDGRGFINAEVNRALDAGVIWINAAGNLGKQVFNGEARTQSIEINNKLDDNGLLLTLSWTDFHENEETCATTDLDLEIYNSANELIKSSVLIQSGVAPEINNPKDPRSCYARESVNLQGLERGIYFVKVIVKNADSQDRFRLVMTENKLGSVEFTPGTNGSEIMAPADNARAFVVGEKTPFSAMGPTADGKVKPDVLIENARVSFTNGEQTAGTSNAAAMVAGAVALLKAQDSSLTGERLLQYAEGLRSRRVIHAGLVRPAYMTPWLEQLTPAGGVVRQDPGTFRFVILSNEVPTQHFLVSRFGLQMRRSDDIVACVENMAHCQVFSKEQDLRVRPPYIEFRQYKNGGASDAPALFVFPVNTPL